ncbi:MAG: Gfo/Idh/MocA family oxidoreductase [Ruminococcaceae bacterium]|nr:Gfo/Idh/MocA family oxidoreductase [Oscillospiraceae bacterium]
MTAEEIFRFEKKELLPIDKEFPFACIGLAHSHIYGMTNSLISAGATLRWVYDDDASAVEAFAKKYPDVKIARSIDEVLSDKSVMLVASADIPSRRASLAINCMRSGHNFFVDKAPAVTLSECDEIERCQRETGMKYFVYYSELIENDAAIFARDLIKRGALGRLYNMEIVAPHRLNAPTRPDWFWKKALTGGILTDIGSHQIEQFLEFSDCAEAKITNATVNNFFHPEYPEFEDFGCATIESKNGIKGYIRVDWMSPDGIKAFGDLRLTLLCEKGYIELRKNCDIGRSDKGNNVFVVTNDGVYSDCVSGKVQKTYFNKLIHDCLEGSDTAMNKDFVYSAMRLTVEAQMMADKNR